MNGGGSQREGDTESETGSRLRAVSTEPDAGLKPTDHARSLLFPLHDRASSAGTRSRGLSHAGEGAQGGITHTSSHHVPGWLRPVPHRGPGPGESYHLGEGLPSAPHPHPPCCRESSQGWSDVTKERTWDVCWDLTFMDFMSEHISRL
ncbi:Hypothetical predicted protein [Lynx pardinus]|uniref:Uncharacterized protein n=1 Tax=Lynx pardinus TaxID=191816 RepID=A0A485PRA7_LYNPA|nr:Hypothetical predicted protein [Lynx pardinus]